MSERETIHAPETRSSLAADVSMSAPTRRLRGTAIVFNLLSDPLGDSIPFREKVAPEAVDRTLRNALDVRALVDHDSSKILGRISSHTLQLKKESGGLRVVIDPPNTSIANDL